MKPKLREKIRILLSGTKQLLKEAEETYRELDKIPKCTPPNIPEIDMEKLLDKYNIKSEYMRIIAETSYSLLLDYYCHGEYGKQLLDWIREAHSCDTQVYELLTILISSSLYGMCLEKRSDKFCEIALSGLQVLKNYATANITNTSPIKAWKIRRAIMKDRKTLHKLNDQYNKLIKKCY